MKAMGSVLANTVTFVLAGGRGKRLDPLTRGRAKPAVPFGDRRIIDFTLSNCLHFGLKHPFVLTQYHADSLHEHVRRWWLSSAAPAAATEAAPVCVPATKRHAYLGTADALFRNLDFLNEAEHVVVLSADHIYEMDYREMIRFHLDHGGAATIGAIACPRASSIRFGVMEVSDRWRVASFEEKPQNPKTLPGQPEKILASMGIYVFNAGVLADVLKRDATSRSSRHDIGSNIVPELVHSHAAYAFNFAHKETGEPHYWRDVGTLDSYYTASMESFGASGSVVSETAQVHETAEIVESILLPGVCVGRGARIRRAILDENVCVAAGASVGFEDSADSQFTVSPKGIVVVPANTTVPLVRDRESLAPAMERAVTRRQEGLPLAETVRAYETI